MICFNQISAEGLAEPFDMILPKGSSAAVVTPREQENETIVRLIMGFIFPLAGNLLVNDIRPEALNDTQLCDYRRKIGIIYSNGGMISNLNVWDNLTLQLSYFGECRSSETERRGIEALRLAGYDGSLGTLPDRLTIFQRRQIAFARVILGEPELVICQSLLDGLSLSEQKQLGRLVRDYRQQNFERTVLFITSYPDSLTGIELDFIYNRGGISTP